MGRNKLVDVAEKKFCGETYSVVSTEGLGLLARFWTS